MNPDWQKVLPPNATMPALYPLTEMQMFRSHRGVIAAMKMRCPNGEMAIDVLPDGVEPAMTVAQLESAMDEYRVSKGYAKPTKPEEHVAEIEKAMNRPEDPIERVQRLERDRTDKRQMEMFADVLAQKNAGPAAPANLDELVNALVEKKLAAMLAEPPAPKAPAAAPVPKK